MAAKVPIPVENIAFERLNLSRHYLTIDCDFTCFLVLNPSGVVPSEGTDIAAFHVGAWQVNAWTLLTKKDFPNQAGFSACLVWDKTLVTDNARAPSAVESDIDMSNSVSNLKGQPVNIVGFSMPDGSSLPTSLVSGSDDSVVTSDNPLPVREFRQRSLEFTIGSHYPFDVFAGLGFQCAKSEGSDVVVFSGVPVTFRGEMLGGEWISYDRGNITYHGMASQNVSKYQSAEFWVALRYKSVEEVLDSIAVDALYSSISTETASLLRWQKSVFKGTLSV